MLQATKKVLLKNNACSQSWRYFHLTCSLCLIFLPVISGIFSCKLVPLIGCIYLLNEIFFFISAFWIGLTWHWCSIFVPIWNSIDGTTPGTRTNTNIRLPGRGFVKRIRTFSIWRSVRPKFNPTRNAQYKRTFKNNGKIGGDEPIFSAFDSF